MGNGQEASPPELDAAAEYSVFRRQENSVIREKSLVVASGKSLYSSPFIKMTVPLPSSHAKVAVPVGAHGHHPDLKILRRDLLVIALDERDLVESQ